MLARIFWGLLGTFWLVASAMTLLEVWKPILYHAASMAYFATGCIFLGWAFAKKGR